jgi:Na+/melibiose symporter-like transporter
MWMLFLKLKVNNIHLMGWVVLAMLPLATAITAAFVKEPINADATTTTHRHAALSDYLAIARKPEVLRMFFSQFALTLGPGWMANLYLFFFTNARLFTEGQAYFLLIIYILAGIFGAPAIGYIGGRFGKHRTLIVATLCYSLGLCTVIVAPKGDTPLGFMIGIPIMIWCGFMANGFDLMTGAMMADVGDQVRLEQGKERMALLYAVTGLAGKLAAAGAVIIAYPLLAAIGYQPTLGAHNTPAALQGLTVVFITGPIFWVVLGGLCFLGWKLDATKHAEIRAELEARDTLVAQRAAQAARGGPLPEHAVLDSGVV